MALVRDIDHGYREFYNRIRRARNRVGAASSQSPTHRISIGIHGDEAAIAYDGSTGTITLLEVASIQHDGDPSLGIPPRRFISDWFDENRPRLAREAKHAVYAEIFGGNPDAMKQLAQRWASEVKARITSRSGHLKPLAPATIAERVRAGIASETPLDATGQLVGSIRAMVDGEYV